MKIEKIPKEKTAREIEIEHDKTQDWAEFDDESKLTLKELKGLVSQGVAKLDFKEGPRGTVESVTVKRAIDSSIVFYSESPGDIKEWLE